MLLLRFINWWWKRQPSDSKFALLFTIYLLSFVPVMLWAGIGEGFVIMISFMVIAVVLGLIKVTCRILKEQWGIFRDGK